MGLFGRLTNRFNPRAKRQDGTEGYDRIDPHAVDGRRRVAGGPMC